MVGIAVVGLVVIWVVAVGWLCLVDHLWAYALAFLLFVVPIGLTVQAVVDHERRSHCVQYDTRLQYNPATKTTMPMRVCVQRGEWLN